MVVLNQLNEFIESEIIYNAGFRKSYSTITLLIKFRDDIQTALKKGEVAIAVFTDY